MILDERLIAEAEARFGTPRDFPLEAVLNEYELEMLSMSLRKLRTNTSPSSSSIRATWP